MNIVILNKDYKLDFRKYANKNTSIVACCIKSGAPQKPITCNTLLKLSGSEYIALRDSKYLIDELIRNKVIEEKYVGEIDEAGNHMLIFRLTEWCINNK